MWFLNALLIIPGLDPNTAQRLFAAGYRTIDELRVANDLVLRERTQIDDAMLEKIRRFVGSVAPLEQREVAA
jgi:predicted RecB family nuclease